MGDRTTRHSKIALLISSCTIFVKYQRVVNTSQIYLLSEALRFLSFASHYYLLRPLVMATGWRG
jgi:hypothetical protein